MSILILLYFGIKENNYFFFSISIPVFICSRSLLLYFLLCPKNDEGNCLHRATIDSNKNLTVVQTLLHSIQNKKKSLALDIL